MNLNNKYLKKIIFFLIVTSILFRGPTFFKIFPSSIGSIRISYLILFLLCFLILIILRYRIRVVEIFIFLTIISIVLINMFIFQDYNMEYFVYILQFFMYFLIWSALINIISLKELFGKLNILLIYLEILAIYEIVTGKLLFHYAIPYEINSFSALNRAYLFFYNGNNLSLFLLSINIVLLGFNLSSNKMKFLAFHFILQCFIFLANDSKLALIVLLITFTVFMIKKYLNKLREKKWKSFFIGIIFSFTLIVIIFLYINSNTLFFYEFINIGKSNISNDSRYNLYSSVLNTFYHNPLGIGLGNSDFYFTTNVHSVILQFLVEFGILGMIFWILYYGFVLSINLKSYKQSYAIVIKYFVLIFPIISVQVSRVIADNALISIWALSLVILIFYKNQSRVEE